jgi:tetratricopeptide (TPR) repeat protein
MFLPTMEDLLGCRANLRLAVTACSGILRICNARCLPISIASFSIMLCIVLTGTAADAQVSNETASAELMDAAAQIKEHPHDPAGYNVRGLMYSYLGDWPESMADFNEAIALEEKQLVANRNNGIALIGIKHRLSLSYVSRARVFVMSHEQEKALLDLNRAIALQPADPTYFKTRADLYVRLGRNDLAAKDREAEMKCLGGARPNTTHVDMLYQAALLQFMAGNYKKSIEIFDRGLVTYPMDPTLLLGRAKALSALGKSSEALKDLDDILRLHPGDTTVIALRRIVVGKMRTRQGVSEH